MTTTHEIHVDGHKLVARALNPEAAGTPLILIHGITASIHFWGADQLPLFCAHGPTYSLSLPGHYPATFPPHLPPADITPAMIARLLATAIRRLVGQQRVTLVGHSTGGFSALTLASLEPDLVARVISISGFAQGKWIGALGLNQFLARCGPPGAFLFRTGFRASRLNRAIFRAFWRVHLADGQALSTYEHLEPLVDQFYPDYQHLDLAAMLKYFKVMPAIDISKKLCRISAPTLAMCGDQDPTVPPAQAHLIADRVPQAELAVIKGGGHFLFMENPTAYRHILRNWLERHHAPGGFRDQSR